MLSVETNETKKGLGIHARRALAYIVLVIMSFLCLFWFYILFVNATRSKGELTQGFTLLPFLSDKRARTIFFSAAPTVICHLPCRTSFLCVPGHAPAADIVRCRIYKGMSLVPGNESTQIHSVPVAGHPYMFSVRCCLR